MYQVLLFGGTIEGRILAEFLRTHHVKTRVCVATEYGGSLIDGDLDLQVSHERLEENQMEDLMRSMPGVLVVDATHPYAALVTENIRQAAARAGCEYLRLLRDQTEADKSKSPVKSVIYVESVASAAAWLSDKEGAALLTTGSKELAEYTKVNDF